MAQRVCNEYGPIARDIEQRIVSDNAAVESRVIGHKISTEG